MTGLMVNPSSDVAVLVVDDDDDLRESVREVLEFEGYTVATATNGAAALRQLTQMRPRLILLDLTMPVMDGATFRERQLENEAIAAIPTIVMTARSNPGAAAAPLLASAALPKPMEIDRLLELVAHYCRP